MTFRPAVATSLTTALLVTLATLPFRDVFGDWSWAAAVIGAAVGAAILATHIETSRPHLSPVAIVAITGLGAATWALLVPLGDLLLGDPFSTQVWRELLHGVFSGWGALLEEQSPLSDPRRAETFAAVLAWIASASGVHIAARRRTALGAVAAGAGVLWISASAALPRGLTPAIFGAAVGAIALVAISTLTRAPDQHWRMRRTLGLTSMIAVAAIAATIAGSIAGGFDREPFDPRSSRATELVTFEVPDILAEYGVRRDRDATVLTVDGTQLPSPLRLRLQVYETHDGERWLPASGFSELATFPGPELLPPGEFASFEVAIDDLDGPWIPLPDRLISTDLVELRWNEATQTALSARPPTRFTVTGTSISRVGMEGLEIARDEVPDRLNEIPAGLPPLIRTVAEEAAADTADALGTIDAITARLRTLGRDETSAPGHSFGRLVDDLSNDRATGAEQIASLHALMLRAVGIPSRVVVGYVTTSPVVEAADLQIWTEVAFRGIGWVPFDPVPAAGDSGTELDPDATATTTTVPDDAAVPARALPRELGPGENLDRDVIGSDGELSLRDAVIAMIVVLLVAVLLLVVARVSRRGFRRSKGLRADVRVLGAWAETVDRLRELGAPVTKFTTIDDVVYMAAATDEALGAEVAVIAELASTALHAPVESSSEDAARAWAQLRVVESRITSVRGRRAIALRHLDPRVFRYRTPRPPPSRPGGRRDRVRAP